MARLFAGLDGTEHRAPDGMSRLVLPEIERRVEVERPLEFVPALRQAVGGAVDEREILVRPHAVAGGAKSLVEARLQELRRVRELAVLVGPHAEVQLFLAPIRAEHGAPRQSQRDDERKREALP